MGRLKPDILDSFRERGLRCTTQRYGVLEYLQHHRVHPTADEIYRAVNRSDPRASRATVYNNLRSLIDAGLVRELVLDGKAARFEAAVERHHHFVCDHCGRVEDIPWFEVQHLADRTELGRRAVRSYELILRGRCEKCG